MKKWVKRTLMGLGAFAVGAGVAAVIGIGYYVGFPKVVGPNETGYRTEELHVQHDGIDLFGKALIPDGDGPFTTVIYAHGAESDYTADMTTLKSLAKSGIACHSFRPDHAELVIYDGQPHVFTGEHKIRAAEETYRFIEETK